MVPRGDRSGTVIEPFLTDQWYVKVEPLAKPAIEAVENGRITFVPDNWKNTYYEWMRNIEDWCISRQIWWGHRIPAWYDEEGNIYVGRRKRKSVNNISLPPISGCSKMRMCWTPGSRLPCGPSPPWAGRQQTEALKSYYPTNVLVTGFDIIFFWVARMIMMGLKFMDDVPFTKSIFMAWYAMPKARRCPNPKAMYSILSI